MATTRYYDGQLNFAFKGKEFRLTYGSVQPLAVIWIVLEDGIYYIEDCEYSQDDTAKQLIARALDKLRSDIAERRVVEVVAHSGYNKT